MVKRFLLTYELLAVGKVFVWTNERLRANFGDFIVIFTPNNILFLNSSLPILVCFAIDDLVLPLCRVNCKRSMRKFAFKMES